MWVVLHNRQNRHSLNIWKTFFLHEHRLLEHPGDLNPITIIPIDHVKESTSNRFEVLKRREAFWIYKLRTLQPTGLNEITKVI